MMYVIIFFCVLITLALWEVCEQLKKIRRLLDHIDSVTNEQLIMEQHRRVGNQ